jgi:VWFA-related protein
MSKCDTESRFRSAAIHQLCRTEVDFAGGDTAVKLSFAALVLVAGLTLPAFGVEAQQQGQPQPSVPDAPAPQKPASLSDVAGPITPGLGAGNESNSTGSSSAQQPAGAQAPAPSRQPVQTAPPDTATPQELGTIFRVNVTYVDVPVTVKDKKGNLVAGLTWRDFRVFENGVYQPLKVFSVDPTPLSIAFVIDQSLTSDVMSKVNDSLGTIQAALTPSDEISVFSYANGSQERTGFTGAQSARVPAVLALTKETGTEELIPANSGPLAGCNVHVNGNCADPNLQPGRSVGSGPFITIPKEIHTLNDAILAAAKELASRPKGRRRIIYVISDGKEYGSKAKYSDVLRYLQTNDIAVWGTLVGDSARWGEGYLSRFHLPFQMYDNILTKYIYATGGEPDSEGSLNGIERSYAKIAEEARNQYTLVYSTHESLYDSKYRKIEVRVERPDLEVNAKAGYWPSAEEQSQ